MQGKLTQQLRKMATPEPPRRNSAGKETKDKGWRNQSCQTSPPIDPDETPYEIPPNWVWTG